MYRAVLNKRKTRKRMNGLNDLKNLIYFIGLYMLHFIPDALKTSPNCIVIPLGILLEIQVNQ
jgi:hypothetical protein